MRAVANVAYCLAVNDQTVLRQKGIAAIALKEHADEQLMTDGCSRLTVLVNHGYLYPVCQFLLTLA